MGENEAPSIAIVIPVLNEEKTVERVVNEFDSSIRDALIIVVDNASTDDTYAVAKRAVNRLTNNNGIVITENSRGKSLAISKAFQMFDADIYVMCDGDCTYDASDIKQLIEGIEIQGFDMVVANRLAGGNYKDQNSRFLHNFGNLLVQKMVNAIYRQNLTDILSGFRSMSKRLVKSYPITVSGFELETDLTLHALDKKLAIKEIPSNYKERPSGSVSKLRTYSDGIKIIRLIVRLIRYYKPILFFNLLAISCLFLTIVTGSAPVLDYLNNNYVEHVPRAILAAALGLLTMLFALTGLVLDSIKDLSARIHSWSLRID